MSVSRQGAVAGRRCLLFVCLVFICFMQAGLYAGRQASHVQGKPWLLSESLPFANSRPIIHDHPIPQLMVNAESNFRKLLSRQSSSLKKAVAEYRRRYHRDPPKGFDEWWRFAQENNVRIIDEYDGLMEDLAPFWEISGEEFRLRAEEVSHLSHFVESLGLSLVGIGWTSAIC